MFHLRKNERIREADNSGLMLEPEMVLCQQLRWQQEMLENQ